MPDLRDLLQQGADVTTGLPDMPAAWSRAVRARRRRRLTTVAAVAAVVGVVAVLGSVIAPGQPLPPQPAVTPRLPPASPLPEFPGPLQARQTYDAGSADLPLGFTTSGAGWVMAAREPGWVSLHRGRARVNLQRWDGVYDPTEDPAGSVDSVPADLLAWVTAHPRLRVGDARTVILAGAQWHALDVSVRTPLSIPPPECGNAPCVLLAQVGVEAVELLASERATLFLSAGVDDPTVILVTAPASSNTAWTAANTLVSSLHERPNR